MTSQGTVTPCFLVSLKSDRIGSCLIGDTIVVYVGVKAKRYTVHKNLLTQYEWFRNRIFYISGSRDYITLKAEDPAVFELLISWLYRKKLNPISTTDGVAKEQATLYIDLYLRACAWEMRELQNALVDKLRARQTCVYGFFSRPLITKIYQATEPQSSLRSYVVDSFIHKGIQWNEGARLADLISEDLFLTRKRALKLQLDWGNHDFVLDCYEALFQLCAESRIRDPDKRKGCLYHNHEKGERCRP